MTAEARTLTRRQAVRTDRVTRLERMIEIRAFEDRCRDLFAEGLVKGTTHTAQGQEAVAVGIAAALQPTDKVTCTYRGHGHALALGMEPVTVIGEILGRQIGSIGGVGGSMHLCDMEIGLLPTFAIVGAGIPVAVGAALSAQVRGTDEIGVAIFGDGTTNIGAFHESLNLASIWQLPTLFVIENNVYGEYSRYNVTTPIKDLAVRADGYAMPWRIVDGQDVDAVAQNVGELVAEVRAGAGPQLVELKTYRYAGHSRSDPAAYRPSGEFDSWLERDPIDRFTARLLGESALDMDALATIRDRVATRIDDAVAAAMDSPEPGIDEMFAHVWATS
jgi:acetoin:2,6-dichlorophenolindophenol oxidoreductase subunit alpha